MHCNVDTSHSALYVFFFFKQKTAYEILGVTGVQTCALPISFAQPWLLLLLLALPLLAYLRGRRGPAAALVFSSTNVLRGLGKASTTRAGKFLRALVFVSLACFIIALARPQIGRASCRERV